MQALILAGGLGTRLRSVVSDRPKPMAFVGGIPFLERLIRRLASQGVEEVILCVGYLWERILEAFGEGKDLGVTLRYSVEETPLGTAGALKKAEALISGTFFVLNGDTFLEVNLRALQNFHREKKALGTLTVVPMENAGRYGSVQLDSTGRIRGFLEKGLVSTCLPCWINGGVYVFERALLRWVPEGRPVSLERETLPALIAADGPLYGYESRGYFIDIGTPEHYARAQKELEERL